MRHLLASVLITGIASTIGAAPPTTDTGSESLGGQLLDDLPSTSSPASETASPNEATAPGAPQQGKLDEIDAELRYFPLRFDDVGGEDVGGAAPSGPMRLVRAGQGMVAAEELLRDRATFATAGKQAGKQQAEVVAQLDELIAELSKQCNCQGGSPNDKPQSSQRSQPKPGKSSGKSGRGTAPARDSDTQLSDKVSRPVDKSELDELVKRLWGHLPEREREQMMQSFSDEFLPKYELEIEQYYRRLSEETGENSPRP